MVGCRFKLGLASSLACSNIFFTKSSGVGVCGGVYFVLFGANCDSFVDYPLGVKADVGVGLGYCAWFWSWSWVFVDMADTTLLA